MNEVNVYRIHGCVSLTVLIAYYMQMYNSDRYTRHSSAYAYMIEKRLSTDYSSGEYGPSEGSCGLRSAVTGVAWVIWLLRSTARIWAQIIFRQRGGQGRVSLKRLTVAI
jgi:hypothetical protein